uniref:Uncharacterized protein n=1 Tax=Anopheles culicifacies TaxID=139723 RepID=A0A182MIW1_9DIPT
MKEYSKNTRDDACGKPALLPSVGTVPIRLAVEPSGAPAPALPPPPPPPPPPPFGPTAPPAFGLAFGKDSLKDIAAGEICCGAVEWFGAGGDFNASRFWNDGSNGSHLNSRFRQVRFGRQSFTGKHIRIVRPLELLLEKLDLIDGKGRTVALQFTLQAQPFGIIIDEDLLRALSARPRPRTSPCTGHSSVQVSKAMFGERVFPIVRDRFDIGWVCAGAASAPTATTTTTASTSPTVRIVNTQHRFRTLHRTTAVAVLVVQEGRIVECFPLQITTDIITECVRCVRLLAELFLGGQVAQHPVDGGNLRRMWREVIRSFSSLSRISQAKMFGQLFLNCEILFTTSGVATRGFDPPIARGRMLPVS